MSAPEDHFRGLAQCLTGFGPEHVSIALEDYDFRAAMERYVGKAHVDQLVKLYAGLAAGGDPPDAIADRILNAPPDPETGALARAMLKFLYLGTWVQPFDHGPHKAARPPGYATGMPPTIPSGVAFVTGLVWKAMQTHPPGDSNDAVGSWEREPPPLKDFTT